MPLTGRRALVIGGSCGIGAEIVWRLAADGAAVAFTYSDSAASAEKLVAELTANGAKVVAIQTTPPIRPRTGLKLVATQDRYGHTSDIGSMVSFLAGPESGYVTGANLNVDGGLPV